MSEIDTTAIDSIYSGNCLSISGRSHLIYTVGKSRANSALYLRIADSTGNGVWCKDWAPAAAIEARGCAEFCVNGQSTAGASLHVRKHNDNQETRSP